MEHSEKINIIGSLIENEINGGCLGGQSGRLDLIAKTTQFHRYLQSELGNLVFEYLQFHARLHGDEELRRRFYDGRNDWVGEFCERLWRTGVFDIWSNHEKAIDDACERQSKAAYKTNRWACIDCEKISAAFKDDDE